jgi:hypothetical protein
VLEVANGLSCVLHFLRVVHVHNRCCSGMTSSTLR